ncbi:aminomethyl-transferring glycine dehydrogenase subunit GcvPA [Endomicrobium proavitum]|uniref:Probable glycine dehydrogenase (decarboxylating) subunit 1 n=1 Tax=Endomicrobium proavitum TaxID=1408281 RepID=A0A0G3WHF7_9BACT|nr:aminomethyl-transferring glycine dehydrogenase subunit GcvPA [Endomicrobium proavitum]AKL97763.1 putative glycine dehydrogenase (decarboxylating) subunit 1 [Endomicrobium proavitum]
MEYTSQNKKDLQSMLESCGVKSVEELFNVIPQELRAKQLDISGGKTEQELLTLFKNLSEKNKTLVSFRGAGIYDHHIPSLVGEVTSRSEFWTAYTPYQAEASQGTLQAIFEYQSFICALTGLDVSNASLYDGATAVAEAALLALRVSGKKKILISNALNPQYIQTVKTYLENSAANIILIDTSASGAVESSAIDAAIDENTAAVIIQSPNYLGVVENMSALSALAKNKNALFIAVVNPLSLAVFQSPSEYGADIAVGEGQPLGIPQSAGGATFGFMSVRKGLEWKMPGRIVGQTVDKNGKRGFVLTLQSREQHIRREKATSNICTNASLNALAACVYMSGWGNENFKKLAETNISKARYAFNKIKNLDGFKAKFAGAVFFNEFVIETVKDVKKINKILLKNKILGPLDLAQYNKNFAGNLLFCVTEQRTKAEIDNLVEILAKA